MNLLDFERNSDSFSVWPFKTFEVFIHSFLIRLWHSTQLWEYSSTDWNNIQEENFARTNINFSLVYLEHNKKLQFLIKKGKCVKVPENFCLKFWLFGVCSKPFQPRTSIRSRPFMTVMEMVSLRKWSKNTTRSGVRDHDLNRGRSHDYFSNRTRWLHRCWRQVDVGDFILVTIFGC